MDAKARGLIRKLGLKPHPEGGYYREIHRAAESVGTSKGRRSALTTIFFLLPEGQRSLFHQVTSDEVWHHYEGADLRLHRVSADMQSRESIRLGPVGGKVMPVTVIPSGDWQAAESLGTYTLVGCTVGPGFDFRDFTLMRDDARAAGRMRRVYPGLARFIG